MKHIDKSPGRAVYDEAKTRILTATKGPWKNLPAQHKRAWETIARIAHRVFMHKYRG